ncbi:MAG: MBL fold metallo-hydrolase [Bacteroidota bacterium]
MITIKTLVFNPFQVNTYLLYDETKDCLIIDAACMNAEEEKALTKFISSNNLKPLHLISTHPHIDHVAGNKFVCGHYNIPLTIHKDSIQILRGVKGHAAAFGFDEVDYVEPANFISEGDKVHFGKSELNVLYTPGHSNGSICLYSEKDNFVIVGDVLFNEGIGRTDFPTGNHALLISSIRNKLFVLPDDTLVYPGHGPSTTIGYEKENNPFLN